MIKDMINAILKKDNLFVFVRAIDDDAKNDPSLILEETTMKTIQLGRVLLKDAHERSYPLGFCRLWVDGITIYRGEYDIQRKEVQLDDKLPYETIVAYLNQIESFGADLFLENYLKALKEFRDELSVREDKCSRYLTVQENMNEMEKLNRLTDLHDHLNSLIFNLSVHIAHLH